MARPIAPTPTLRGKDAARLIKSLENVASSEELVRRVAVSKARLALVLKCSS